MTDVIKLWIEGDLHPASATIDGEKLVCIPLPGEDEGRTVELYMRLHHFVAIADHLKMAADSFLDDDRRGG